MGGGYVGNALVFLIQTLFSLYILAVLLRFLLQLVRADFYNPLVQVLVKITNPPLKPLRRVIPGLAGIDMAAIVLMLGLQLVALVLVAAIIGFAPSLPGLLIMAVAELLALVLNVYLFSIIIQAILSWINPGAYNPFTAVLYRLNEPILGPARRLLPPIGGLDLSPILVLIGIQLAKMLVYAPLMDFGRGLA
ncbi:MAG: YggT family protein [Gammaproteobacteria bacterium]